MKKQILIIFLILTVLSLLVPACGPEPFKLTIMHTSENHGHWDAVEVSKVSQGGIARRATLVKSFRALTKNTLLLDSGDISQGTYFYPYENNRGREGKVLYNLLGYDAVVLGNHEFDAGPRLLDERFLDGANFSVVVANMDLSGEPALAAKVKPFVTKTIGGEKIGIFGLITDDVPVTSSPGPNIKMKDTVQAAREVVAELTRQGINKIILLSHLGFPADQYLASKVSGIDVIISGHTDTLMGSPDILDSSLGKPIANYPVEVKSAGDGSTLIAHDYIWGRMLGYLNLEFDSAGKIIRYTGTPILVDKNIFDDEEVKITVEKFRPSDPLIGSTAVSMDGRRATVRNQESNLGNMVADAMLWSTSNDKTSVAIANGGGMRASLSAGDIKYSQVLEALPFGNRIVQVDLPGADLLAALENGISDIKLIPEESGGRFPQVAGLKFSADISKPAGQRVTEVMIGTSASGYKSLEKAATYRIVTLDYILGGGDGYETFKKGSNVRGGDVPLDIAVAEYLMANSPVSPKVEGRIILTK